MKLLFICTPTVSEGKLHIASWIEAIISLLDDSFEIFITLSDSSQQGEMEIAFFSIGTKSVALVHYNETQKASQSASFENVIHKVAPDVVQIFGTEQAYALTALKKCEKLGILDRTIVFAQGFCSVCARHYVEGVPFSVINRVTFRDFLRRDSTRQQIKSFEKRAQNENVVLSLTHNFIGRTTMDRALLQMQNETAQYYLCNDVMRGCFYSGQWAYETCRKHSVFISQYYYPLKGFHYLLEAAVILRRKYPDFHIVAAGNDPIGRSSLKNSWRDTSYVRYIKEYIRDHHLESHITFTGELSAEEMKQAYLKSNAYILPSTIENSPNSLAEAMLLGTPSIAADVGGVTDVAVHEKEALIYPSAAPYLLAHYIARVFDDVEFAKTLGLEGQKRAQAQYSKETNGSTLKNIYFKVAGKEG